MTDLERRQMLTGGALGLAAIGSGALTLSLDARPTAESGKLDTGPVLEIEPPRIPEPFNATEDNILGPYHREGAPFRAKITPATEPGETLVIRGRVWSITSKRPIPNAVLHIWQANARGRYDNDDQRNPPKKGVFHNRARLITDETGYYEYETIKPGRYQIGKNRWRPAHIHYIATAQGHKSLVTQLYFKGDPYNKSDDFIKPSLIIDPKLNTTPNGNFSVGTFDIVLANA